MNVDAIVFWVVWNAEKAMLEVQNFAEAISLSAQTALRESIGRHELAQMITDRETLGHELQRILDEKTNPWGITVHSVEIRDVQIPKALRGRDVARQAQAERERQARIILGHGRDGDLGQVREGGAGLPRQPDRPPPARDEHALRGDQGEGRDGHRPVLAPSRRWAWAACWERRR